MLPILRTLRSSRLTGLSRRFASAQAHEVAAKKGHEALLNAPSPSGIFYRNEDFPELHLDLKPVSSAQATPQFLIRGTDERVTDSSVLQFPAILPPRIRDSFRTLLSDLDKLQTPKELFEEHLRKIPFLENPDLSDAPSSIEEVKDLLKARYPERAEEIEYRFPESDPFDEESLIEAVEERGGQLDTTKIPEDFDFSELLSSTVYRYLDPDISPLVDEAAAAKLKDQSELYHELRHKKLVAEQKLRDEHIQKNVGKLGNLQHIPAISEALISNLEKLLSKEQFQTDFLQRKMREVLVELDSFNDMTKEDAWQSYPEIAEQIEKEIDNNKWYLTDEQHARYLHELEDHLRQNGNRYQ